MITFTQLLARNLVYGLIFYVFILASCILFFTQQLEQQGNQHKEKITALAVQLLISKDTKQFNKILRTSHDYQLLQISNKSGQSLYSFSNGSLSLIPSWLAPQPMLLSLERSDLTIRFQLNYEQQLGFVSKLMIALLLITVLIIVLTSSAGINRYKRFYVYLNKQIKICMSTAIDPQQNTDQRSEKPDRYSALKVLPELVSGIEQIRKHIANNASSLTVLNKQAYIDPLTNLQNRSRFVHYFHDEINTNGCINSGVLLITRCSQLQSVNQRHGYNAGDLYLTKVAELITTTFSISPLFQQFRLSGCDFACILPDTTLAQVQSLADQLTAKFNQYQIDSTLESTGHTGIVSFDKKSALGELLASADAAISIAQSQGINAWYCHQEGDLAGNASAHYGNQNWRCEIEDVLQNRRIKLLLQPVEACSRENKAYGEILTRFINAKDEVLPTVTFIAMAQRLDQIVAVDRMIIETAVEKITGKVYRGSSFALNINPRSINDEYFVIWLERHLLRNHASACNLVFEITEYALLQNIKASKRFIDMLHRVGCRITVERFGVSLTSFKFFRELKPDFIKMDRIYTRNIDEDKENQYFLRLVIDVAHRLGILVLAECVENKEEKHTLSQLFIDGYQGFYIGKPAPL